MTMPKPSAERLAACEFMDIVHGRLVAHYGLGAFLPDLLLDGERIIAQHTRHEGKTAPEWYDEFYAVLEALHKEASAREKAEDRAEQAETKLREWGGVDNHLLGLEVDQLRERVRELEGQVAAFVEAINALLPNYDAEDEDIRTLKGLVRDAAAAARRHDAEVAAKALEDAATWFHGERLVDPDRPNVERYCNSAVDYAEKELRRLATERRKEAQDE